MSFIEKDSKRFPDTCRVYTKKRTGSVASNFTRRIDLGSDHFGCAVTKERPERRLP